MISQPSDGGKLSDYPFPEKTEMNTAMGICLKELNACKEKVLASNRMAL